MSINLYCYNCKKLFCKKDIIIEYIGRTYCFDDCLPFMKVKLTLEVIQKYIDTVFQNMRYHIQQWLEKIYLAIFYIQKNKLQILHSNYCEIIGCFIEKHVLIIKVILLIFLHFKNTYM